MKKTTLFTVAAACGAFAFAVPDWNQGLQAQVYANPVFHIYDATVTQQLNVSGCKALKTVTQGDITLYEDGAYQMVRDDWGTVMTGTWAKVSSKSSNTFYLSINNVSMGNLFSELDTQAKNNCDDKYPAMTYVSIVEPTVLIKKDTIVVKIKNGAAKGTLQFKGKQQNDSKGAPGVTGNISVKMTLKGQMFPG